MTKKEKLFQDPQPGLPPLAAHPLLVLRRVKAGDPFRDKSPGAHGRSKRLETLGYLQQRGLIRQNRDGFWRLTRDGTAYLAAHPVR